MTWNDAASGGTTGAWVREGGGASLAWGDLTFSNTTARNTSRFVLLNQSALSVRGGVDFGVYLRTVAGGHGATFLITTDDPVRLHTSGSSLI